MTGQTPDVLRNNGVDYVILECEGGELFSPGHSSLKVCSMSTACAKGYRCLYEVSTQTGALTLTALEVRTVDNAYPPIDGVSPLSLNTISFTTSSSEANNNENGSSNRDVCIHSATYVGLQKQMSQFDGRIMIATNYIKGNFSQSDDATKYGRVLEIHVDKGNVVQAIDLSEEVSQQRKQNEENRRLQNGQYQPYAWWYQRYKQLEESQQASIDLYAHEDDL